ncbi:MAG: TonB-dependent receptor [Niabella sp.]|nr:TonB-dependent receptor [Niabella sp.]
MQIRLLFVMLFASVSPIAFSQAKLSGKITDGETGSPIVGASVAITGEQKGVTTDVDGGFYISVKKNVKYSLTVSSIGYQTKEVSDIQVTDTEVPVVNITLDKLNQQLQEVVVKSSAKRESVASLYNVQKLSASISDGISADIIKKSPDRNTGDVLKRVSGASIQDDKFVIIRGLSERYNTALLNNAILPSTEPDKKAFAFNILPSSIVDNIVVYKSATPDLPGDFAGGAIKITTKQYPTTKLSELSLSIGYNTLTTFKETKTSEPKGKLDFLGFFDYSRDLPNSYYKYRNSFIGLPNDYKIAATKLFSNSYGYKNGPNALPNLSLNYTGGNSKLFSGEKKLGYIYSIGYGIGQQFKPSELFEYDIAKTELFNYNTDAHIQKKNLNALLNLTYAYNNNNTISWKNLFNNDFSVTTAARSGVNTSNGQNNTIYFKSSQNEARQDGIFNSVFEGKHKLNSSVIDWNASYSMTYRNEPDQRILTFTSMDNQNFVRKVSNENSPSIQNAGRVYSNLKENIFGANLNYQYPFQLFDNEQKFKAGYAGYFRLKDVEVNALGYASLYAGGAEIPAASGSNPFSIFSRENIDEYQLTVANIGNNSTNYQGKGYLNAGYLMLNNRFSNKLKLDWGVRVENYDQQLIPVSGSLKVKKQDLDFLPSGNFTYEVTPKSNIRLAGSQSVNRPEFREIASYSLYDYTTDFIYRGNPDLVRSKNTNGDLRYELFPAAGEIISVTGFYKYFKNPIEQVNQGNSILSYQNAEHAKVYGAEMEVRKKLSFIGGNFFDALTFYTNLSYIKGSIKLQNSNINNGLMQGLSPYLINGGLNYANNDFSVNVLFNRIGPRLAFRGQGDAGVDIYEKPRSVLDAQVSKKFAKNKLELKATVSDILAQPFVMYYRFDKSRTSPEYDSDGDRVTRRYKLGTSANLSLKYNF